MQLIRNPRHAPAAGGWVSVSTWEQDSAWVQKMPGIAAETRQPGARFLGCFTYSFRDLFA